MDFIAHARKTLTIEQNGIAAISQQLDDTFNAAIQALLDTIERNGKIVIAGVGKNWHIGNKIAATLNSTGSPAAVMHPIEAMHGLRPARRLRPSHRHELLRCFRRNNRTTTPR